MKKLESNLTNMTAVLVGVALITGSLLAWLNKATEAPRLEQQALSLSRDMSVVMGGGHCREVSVDTLTRSFDARDYTFVVHTLSAADGRPAGKAVETEVMGYGGPLAVLVGFDNEGKVLGYAIRKTSETPGLGIKADMWFQHGGKGSIIGRCPHAEPLAVTKDNGDIDAITASTITSRAFLKAVNQAAEVIGNRPLRPSISQ